MIHRHAPLIVWHGGRRTDQLSRLLPADQSPSVNFLHKKSPVSTLFSLEVAVLSREYHLLLLDESAEKAVSSPRNISWLPRSLPASCWFFLYVVSYKME